MLPTAPTIRPISPATKPLLILTAPWDDRHVAWFAERLDADVVAFDAEHPEHPEQLQRAQLVAGAIRGSIELDRTGLTRLEGCPFIQVGGVGVDHIDLAAAEELGIGVSNCGDANAASVAEWTIMAMLAVLHRSHTRHEALRAGKWAPSLGAELGGKCVGVVGVGQIGWRVADLATSFGATVIAHDPDPRSAPKWPLVDLDALLDEADVVTVHVPLIDATHHLIDETAIGRMKPRAIIINAARGGVIDEQALCAALQDRTIAGAALDVFEREPLSTSHPLRTMPNVLLSPHAAATTYETAVRTREVAASNLALVLAGKTPAHLVTQDRSQSSP